jgi:hypothetical protein
MPDEDPYLREGEFESHATNSVSTATTRDSLDGDTAQVDASHMMGAEGGGPENNEESDQDRSYEEAAAAGDCHSEVNNQANKRPRYPNGFSSQLA